MRRLDQALARSRQNLGALRLAEVKELAAVYRDKRRQPDEALRVLREWLDIHRGRLSDTDAEGPISLANLYDELLQDRVTAIALLRKAWKIDPGSEVITEAFRTRGYRKAKDDWVEATPEARAHAVIALPINVPLRRNVIATRPVQFQPVSTLNHAWGGPRRAFSKRSHLVERI